MTATDCALRQYRLRGRTDRNDGAIEAVLDTLRHDPLDRRAFRF
jgi:hypothetical protein